MKTNTRLLIYRERNRDSVQCSHEVFYHMKEALFKEFFFFVFKFIVYVLTTL